MLRCWGRLYCGTQFIGGPGPVGSDSQILTSLISIMDKFCVFCGQRPEGKSNEHVLPQWLIQLTGDPNRVAVLGYKKEPGLPERKYSFKSFVFPSCENCNNQFAPLEEEARSVIVKMLASEPLSATDLNTLFDWFDKVRTGLWLAYFYLDENIAGILPHFYIASRVRLNDRMLLICKADCERTGLAFVGCETPCFSVAPCCFALIINNLYLLNMSFNFLFARRLGFPYPEELFVREEHTGLEGELLPGRERVMTPLLKRTFVLFGTEIYQPMFPYQVGVENLRGFYDTPYVREQSLEWGKGMGGVFIQDQDGLRRYPAEPSLGWLPRRTYERHAINEQITIETLEWQLYIQGLWPPLANVPESMRRRERTIAGVSKSFNRLMLEKIKKEGIGEAGGEA